LQQARTIAMPVIAPEARSITKELLWVF